MKKLVLKGVNLSIAFSIVFGFAGKVSAAERAASAEAVNSFGTAPVCILTGLVILAAVAAVVIALKKKKSSEETPVVIFSPAKPAPRRGTTLEAQGSFLQGKHFGIVSHAVIGRSSSADIRIDDPKISGTHCQLTWENEKLYIMDLNSTNGTTIADTGKLPPKAQVQLYDGSVFWLGDQKFSFRVKIK